MRAPVATPPAIRLARLLALSGALIGAASSASIAQPPSPQPPRPKPCTTAAYRQFDFWLGEWEVRNPQGKLAGSSRITSILGGCAIHEQWTGAGGANGESFNIFDLSTGKWHQTWVDNAGLLAQFDGGLSPQGAMLLEGPGRSPQGDPARSRMTFTPLPDGAVRQHWEYSTDNGATWQTSFDGTYRRKR